MAKPSLNEIFGGKPSLDQIFSGTADTPVNVPANREKTIGDIASEIGKTLMQPASAALEVISYLDKPRGAIAGAVKAYQDDASIIEGAKKGWQENTSWKETFNPEWVKENPKTAAVTGFIADVVGDPAIIVSPAKIAGSVARGSKAVGLTDALAPAAKRIAESEIGQKTGQTLSEIFGVNRATDEAGQAYNATKAATMGATKEGLDQVEKIIAEALPNADRMEVEAIVQRMVEAYPDLGQFARSADKATARDTVLNALFKDMDVAQGSLKTAKEASGKVGPLAQEEKAVADILEANKVKPDELGKAVTTAQNMGEIIPQAAKTAQGIDEHVKIKKAAYKLIQSGKLTEEDLPRLRGLFSDDELKAMMPGMKERVKGTPALSEIEAGMKKPGQVSTVPASQLEGSVLEGIGRQTKIKNAPLEVPNRQQYKWEDVIRRGYDGKLTQDELQSVKGILTPEEIATFSEKAATRERLKQAVRETVVNGTLTPQDVIKHADLFTSVELKEIGKELAKRYPAYSMGVSKNANVRQLIYGIKEIAEKKSVEEAKVKDALAKGLGVNLEKTFKDVEYGGLSNVIGKEKVAADLPSLYKEPGAISSEKGVLPSIETGRKPQNTGDLANLTEDGRRLLAGVKNVPELAQKIRTEQDLQKQLSAVERARDAIQKADVSPEKTTQVIDSALKSGYTPAQVEAMFNASEVMRGINQMMTSEAMKRALIPIEAAGEFSGGRHLRRMYAALENPEAHYNNLVKAGNKETADRFWEAYSKFEGVMKSKGLTINMATFESRKSLPKELQDQLGRLYEATYPFAKGNKVAAEQFARYDYLKAIADKYGSDVMKPGHKKIPITPDGKYGQLEGKFLPDKVYKETVFGMDKFDRTMGAWEKNVQRWKALKLINPASISRNTLSGAAMANVFGDVPFQKIPGLIADTLADMRQGSSRYLEARNAGIFETNIAKADLDAIMAKVRGEKPGTIDRLDAVLGKGMNVFSMPDNFWRMVVYNNARNMGLSERESAAKSMRALFDYTNAPKWIESLSRSGLVPFAKFPFFATKETARALWNKPAQVTKYTKAQNQVNTEDREKIMPDYLKAKTLLPLGGGERMVNGKLQKVQNNIDLSYILPFANDVTVGNPILDAIQLARTGKNSLGMDVIKPGMTGEEKAAAYAKFAANALGPSVVAPYSVEKAYNAYKGNVDEKGRQYDPFWAAMQLGAGIKNVPINIDELYKQKMTKIESDRRNIAAMRNRIQKDQSLTVEQKKERIADHSRQLLNLNAEAQEVKKAYLREKVRGAK